MIYIIDNFKDQCYVNKYNTLSYTPLLEIIYDIYKNGKYNKQYMKYFKFLVEKSNLNYKNIYLISSMDGLLYSNYWLDVKDILIHKKMIISKHIFNN